MRRAVDDRQRIFRASTKGFSRKRSNPLVSKVQLTYYLCLNEGLLSEEKQSRYRSVKFGRFVPPQRRASLGREAITDRLAVIPAVVMPQRRASLGREAIIPNIDRRRLTLSLNEGLLSEEKQFAPSPPQPTTPTCLNEGLLSEEKQWARRNRLVCVMGRLNEGLLSEEKQSSLINLADSHAKASTKGFSRKRSNQRGAPPA